MSARTIALSQGETEETKGHAVAPDDHLDEPAHMITERTSRPREETDDGRTDFIQTARSHRSSAGGAASCWGCIKNDDEERYERTNRAAFDAARMAVVNLMSTREVDRLAGLVRAFIDRRTRPRSVPRRIQVL
jgi:hypothetical protein